MVEGSGAPAPGSKKKRRRPRKARRRPARKTLPVSCMEGVEATLASAVRETYTEMFGSRSGRVRPFGLELKVSVDPGDPWRLHADPSLEDQIRAALREMATQAEVFRTGRVYCYRCDSPDCPHGHPPRPTSVFGGYSSTGLPVWPEFSQVLLEQKHPKVDLLYDSAQADLVAMYMNAEMLKKSQLNVFGRQSKTYDVLGQVVFGFLKMRLPDEGQSEPDRVAFTLQAVEYRRLDRTPRLELNVVARLSDGSPAMDAIKGPYQTRISDVIGSARRRISSLRPARKTSSRTDRTTQVPDTASLVEEVLQGLARKLEKVGRQRGRRTAHAERHRVRNRPTSKAWEDAFSVPEDLILWDKHERTFVVLGPRNRVHVFSQEGRHVTSLVLPREAVRSRRRRKRWLTLTEDQKERFVSVIGMPVQEASKASETRALSQKHTGRAGTG